MIKGLVILITLLFTVGCKTDNTLILGTTTSVENSGLVNYLLPYFEEEYDIDVSVVTRGTGAILQLGESKDIDIVLVHDKESEVEFVNAGYGEKRHNIMYNDFVFLGPSELKTNSLSQSLSYLYQEGEAHKLVFISRGDNSGTDVKEKILWQKYGYDTSKFSSWYKETGTGMSDVLLMSSEMGAYTFSDRGTYLFLRDKLDLDIVYFDKNDLINEYSAIVVSQARNINNAHTFLKWLISPETKKIISSYKINDEVLFYPVN